MEPSSNTNPEEIDIISLLRSIGQVFKTLIKIILKNWLIITAIMVVFVGLGYFSRYILPKKYDTDAIILTHEVPAEVCIMQLQNLNKLIHNKEDFALLANRLRISREDAEEIANLSAEKIAGEHQDSSGQFFTIHLRITDKTVLDTVQAGIIHFLENNQYSAIRKETKRASLNKLKLNLEKNIQSLDSLKTALSTGIIPKNYGQGIILGEPINPVSIYQADVALFKEQLKIYENLERLDNIEIIQPFIKIEKSNYFNFNRIILYSLLCGLIMAGIVVLGRERLY
jgi:hypothetical protein